MKSAIKYLLMLCMVFGLKAVAQQPGDSKGLANKSTVKGRHELDREIKIKKRERKNAKEQERKAFKKSPLNKSFSLGKKSRKRHHRKSKEKGIHPGKKEESKG